MISVPMLAVLSGFFGSMPIRMYAHIFDKSTTNQLGSRLKMIQLFLVLELAANKTCSGSGPVSHKTL